MSPTTDRIPLYQYLPLVPGRFRLVRLLNHVPTELGDARSSDEPEDPDETRSNIGQDIIAELVESYFDDPIPFEAVSYCWSGHLRASPANMKTRESQATADRRIVIVLPKDIHRVAGYIPISRSLDLALRHLQDRTDKALFVDQICINQTDLHEKGYLVNRMGDIYNWADRVLAWLGPLTPEAADFLTFMENMLENESSQGFARLGTHDYDTLNKLRASVVARRLDQVPTEDALRADRDELRELATRVWDILPLRGFADLASRQWFGRMWIVQEACLPSSLILLCGDRACEADDFERFAILCLLTVEVKAASLSAEDITPEYPTVSDIVNILALVRFTHRIFGVRRTIHREGSDRLPILHLLSKLNAMDNAIASGPFVDSKKFRAGDARDCFYAVRGLTKPDDITLREVPVDYDRPVSLVFTDLAAALVQEHTDVLLFSQNGRKVLPSLPSWVPDWTSELRAPYSYMNSDTPFFAAGWGRGTPWTDVPEICVDRGAQATLVIPGYRIDTVERAGKHIYRTETAEKRESEESFHLFLCEVSLFCRLVLQKVDPPTVSPGSKEEMPCMLASGGRGLAAMPVPPDQRLGPVVKGKRLICAMHETYEDMSARHARVLELRVPELQAYAKRMAAVEDPIHAKWRERRGWTWTLHNWLGLGEGWDEYEFYRKFNAWWAARSGIKEREDGENLDPEVREAALERRGMYGANLDSQAGRRCFVTEQGYFGLGPEVMETGDVVVVLKGATTPMVLRPDPDVPKRRFTYVGEAYCHGIMDGELPEQRAGEAACLFHIA